MAAQSPSIEFFNGISEELSSVSLRRGRFSNTRTVLMTFEQLKALERFNSFTRKSSNSMRLLDSEGEITVSPSSVQFIFAGPEGDELQRMECKFEIEREDHWQRFLRFMNRYAEANGLDYSDSKR